MRIATVMLTGLMLFSAACVGDIVPLPERGQDGGGGGNGNGTGGGNGNGTGGGNGNGSGGATDDMGSAAPPTNVTFSAIEADIEAKSCTIAACHGGTQTPVLKNGDVTNNYTNFKMFATTGDQSLVLTKNLAGSGVSHGGGSAFPSNTDAIYVRWLAWINAGNPQ
jgi:hypothetical protein